MPSLAQNWRSEQLSAVVGDMEGRLKIPYCASNNLVGFVVHHETDEK